jgi:hypothetical protein
MQNVGTAAVFNKILLQKPVFAFRIAGSASARPERKSHLQTSQQAK